MKATGYIKLTLVTMIILIASLIPAKADTIWEYDEYGNPIYYRYTSSRVEGNDLYETEHVHRWRYTYSGGQIINTQANYTETQMKNHLLVSVTTGEYVYNSQYYRSTTTTTNYASDGVTVTSQYRYYNYYSYVSNYSISSTTYTTYHGDGSRTVEYYYNSSYSGYNYSSSSTYEYNDKGQLASVVSTWSYSYGGNTYSGTSQSAYSYIYDGGTLVSRSISSESYYYKNGVLYRSYSGEYTYTAESYNGRTTIKDYNGDGRVTKEILYNYTYNYITRVYSYDTTTIVYEYYASGNVFKKTVYEGGLGAYPQTTYIYYDEDFYGNGIGRLYQYEFNPASPHGVIRITYREYWEGTDIVKIKDEFIADSNFTTYEYYISGRLYKKILVSGGNVTLEYTDEDYLGEGYGKLIKETQGDGSYKVFSDYFEGTRLAGTVTEYEYSEEFGDYVPVVKYTYYASGNLKTKVTSTRGRVDWPDWETYTYYDEDFYGGGLGRLYQYEFNPASPHGVIRITYREYWEGTDIVKIKDEFIADSNFTTYEYYISGRLYKKILVSGGNVTLEYTDEDYLGEGYGKLIKETQGDGSYKIFSDYFEGTRLAGTVTEYEYSEEFGDYVPVVKYTYYASGNLKTKVTSTRGRVDWPDWETYTYYDEDFYGGGLGRLYQYEFNPASPHGVIRITYREYWEGTDIVKIKDEFIADSNFTTYEYYASGNLQKVTKTSAGVTYLTLSYADIDIDGDGVGRIVEEIQSNASGIIVRYVYRDYYEGTEQYRFKDEYDGDGNFVATYMYDIDGNYIGTVSQPLNQEALAIMAVEESLTAQISDRRQYNIQGQMADDVIAVIEK